MFARVRRQVAVGCPSFGGQRTACSLSPLRKYKLGVVRHRAHRAHSLQCNSSVLQSSVRLRIKQRRRIFAANANLTIRSSGQPPGYRVLPLTSNVSHLFVPSMNAPPHSNGLAMLALAQGGSGPAPASSRSGAFATTGKALESGARLNGLGSMPTFVERRAKLRDRLAGHQSSARYQMANPAFERTTPGYRVCRSSETLALSNTGIAYE